MVGLKASELIAQLTQKMEEHGDLTVFYDSDGIDWKIEKVAFSDVCSDYRPDSWVSETPIVDGIYLIGVE